MTETRERIAGSDTVRVSVGVAPRVTVVVLHGYAMRPEDLVPFAHSLGISADFYYPCGPVPAQPSGWGWWPIDQERRAHALAKGPRDLFEEHPTGAAAARRLLAALVAALVAELGARHAERPLVLIGFSQGGMLAIDALLRSEVTAAGLVLLSSSRICADEWAALAPRLKGLPVLVSHGEKDDDLAFSAGEALRDFCAGAGAAVTWVPFPEGHQIPLLVWRAVRRFIAGIA